MVHRSAFHNCMNGQREKDVRTKRDEIRPGKKLNRVISSDFRENTVKNKSKINDY